MLRREYRLAIVEPEFGRHPYKWPIARDTCDRRAGIVMAIFQPMYVTAFTAGTTSIINAMSMIFGGGRECRHSATEEVHQTSETSL